MTRPPIASEQYERLWALAKQGAADLAPRLTLDDAIALTALLNAWKFIEPVDVRQATVTTSEGKVRTLWTAGQGDRRITLPMDLSPADADNMARMITEAAEFARMSCNTQEGQENP